MQNFTQLKQVAFLGVGSMGARMAKRLLANGIDLTVCDTRTEALTVFSQLGAKTTQIASECADIDILIVMVPSDQALYAVTVGPNGAINRADGIRPKIICVMSTTLPKTIRDISAQAAQKGVVVIDAPVSGGPARAEDGSLSIFVGSKESDFKKIAHVLKLMGKNLYHCGDVGSASAVKVINNLICITNIYVTAEAYEIASGLGIDPHKLAPILDVSTARNFISADMNQSIKQFQEWVKDETSFQSINNILKKDLSFALDLIDAEVANNTIAKKVLEYAQSDDVNLLKRWKLIAQSPHLNN